MVVIPGSTITKCSFHWLAFAVCYLCFLYHNSDLHYRNYDDISRTVPSRL